jgi:anthranilate synthase
MRYIEEMELKPRGWYGGSVGYMSFSGEVDTGIIIRTAYIEKGKLVYNSGATLLYDSTPEGELKETDIKAAAFHRIFANP